MKSLKEKRAAELICLSVNMEATGANIKEMIKNSGYSIDEIMTFTGITSPQAIYKWYSGKSIPSIETLLILSEVLSTSIKKLLVIETINI